MRGTGGGKWKRSACAMAVVKFTPCVDSMVPLLFYRPICTFYLSSRWSGRRSSGAPIEAEPMVPGTPLIAHHTTGSISRTEISILVAGTKTEGNSERPSLIGYMRPSLPLASQHAMMLTERRSWTLSDERWCGKIRCAWQMSCRLVGRIVSVDAGTQPLLMKCASRPEAWDVQCES